jgi:hypothetical protein
MKRGEDFSIPQFVTKFRVEALIAAIFPGASGLDEERFDTNPGHSWAAPSK